nr:hypothetical protein CPGR_05738 [Mycolicibacter nonchromogenicus]
MLRAGRVRRLRTYSSGAPAIWAASATTPRYLADGSPRSQASTTYSHANTGAGSLSTGSEVMPSTRSTRRRIFLSMPNSEPSQLSMFFSSSGVTS